MQRCRVSLSLFPEMFWRNMLCFLPYKPGDLQLWRADICILAEGDGGSGRERRLWMKELKRKKITPIIARVIRIKQANENSLKRHLSANCPTWRKRDWNMVKFLCVTGIFEKFYGNNFKNTWRTHCHNSCNDMLLDITTSGTQGSVTYCNYCRLLWAYRE